MSMSKSLDETNEKIGYTFSLTIREGYRNLKLGTELLKQIKIYSIERGFNAIAVKVHCENQVSGDFYKKNGFKLFHKDKTACIYKQSHKTS